jgi:hypothetical protein
MAVTLANVSAATSSTQIFAASTSVDPRALGQRLIWNDSTAIDVRQPGRWHRIGHRLLPEDSAGRAL